MQQFQKGDYVLATKYSDGDPKDQWCIGFYECPLDYSPMPPRHHIVDGNGRPFRGNGFRRVKKISHARGMWLLDHAGDIEMGARSLWWWVRQPMEMERATNE